MNKRIAIAGASGVLGQELLSLFAQSGYYTRSIIRDENKCYLVDSLSQDVWVGDASRPEELAGCFVGIDTVISTVGKSISLFNREAQTFAEIDFRLTSTCCGRHSEAGLGILPTCLFLPVKLHHNYGRVGCKKNLAKH